LSRKDFQSGDEGEVTKMRLVIGYDGSPCADAALDDLQRAGLPAEGRILLTLVTEIWLSPLSGVESKSTPAETERIERNRQILRRATERLTAGLPRWEIETLIEAGSPAATILHRAAEWGADMIVVGSHGFTKVERFFIGSVSQRVAGDAHCSVRIARGRLEEGEKLPSRLVIGVDGSIDSDMAVYVAANRNWPADTEVRLVTSVGPLHISHPFTTIEEEKALVGKIHDRAAANLRTGAAQHGKELMVSSVISFEDPKQAIIHEAESWGADTIFIGSRGHGRIGRALLGSVAAAVATRAHCSVEIVRRTSTANWEEDFQLSPSGKTIEEEN
jgi:nucleotide-binding universal stress UspA family protein